MISRSSESIQALYILTLLEQAIQNDTSVFAYSIKLAVKDGVPAKKIVQMVMDQVIDNEAAMVQMIGRDLVDRIYNFSSVIL